VIFGFRTVIGRSSLEFLAESFGFVELREFFELDELLDELDEELAELAGLTDEFADFALLGAAAACELSPQQRVAMIAVAKVDI
jgi:hypothetical protein